MKDILEAIRKSLQEGNYFAALFLTITLPSICGAIASTDGVDTRKKYVAWYDRYVDGLYLKGEDCYSLRCSLLHQGKTTHKNSSFSRVLFSYPNRTNAIYHNNILGNALNLDISLFCDRIIKGVETWLREVEETENYKKNIFNVSSG